MALSSLYIPIYVSFCHLVSLLGNVCLGLGRSLPLMGVLHLYYNRLFALRCFFVFICVDICSLVALAPHGGGFVGEIAFSYT